MVFQRNVLGLVCGLAIAGVALAQANGALRWHTGNSLGLQAGQQDLRVPCGNFAFSCSDASTVPLYTSAHSPRGLAMQVGPADSLAAARSSKAQGLNVSVIGKAGIGWDLGVYGRVGTTFNRAGPGLSTVPGTEGGLTYGVGLSWDFSRGASAAVGMDSYDVRSAVGEVRDLRTSLGLQWRY